MQVTLCVPELVPAAYTPSNPTLHASEARRLEGTGTEWAYHRLAPDLAFQESRRFPCVHSNRGIVAWEALQASARIELYIAFGNTSTHVLAPSEGNKPFHFWPGSTVAKDRLTIHASLNASEIPTFPTAQYLFPSSSRAKYSYSRTFVSSILPRTFSTFAFGWREILDPFLHLAAAFLLRHPGLQPPSLLRTCRATAANRALGLLYDRGVNCTSTLSSIRVFP